MSNKKIRSRMDFTSEIKAIDKDKGLFEITLTPDPRRYEWQEKEGKKYLYDKYDKIIYPQEFLKEFADQLKNKPIYFDEPKISNVEEYIKSRIPVIETMIYEDKRNINFVDKSEQFLESLSERGFDFVIMCIDIVGSTKLSTELDPNKYIKLISIILYEISEIIPDFHGHVLKYTGDGLIAYFPEPNFITKNDLAIDCALTIRRLIYNTLNPIFNRNNFPTINIRIGLDSGEAHVITIGSLKTKRHRDIIGDVVNLSTKIQGLGKPGDILLGDATVRNLYITWREICEEIDIPENWIYKDKDDKPYRVHKIKFG